MNNFINIFQLSSEQKKDILKQWVSESSSYAPYSKPWGKQKSRLQREKARTERFMGYQKQKRKKRQPIEDEEEDYDKYLGPEELLDEELDAEEVAA